MEVDPFPAGFEASNWIINFATKIICGLLKSSRFILYSPQRLKAALHYGVGQVCSEIEGTTFSRDLVATITETTFKQCELLAADLELFAK